MRRRKTYVIIAVLVLSGAVAWLCLRDVLIRGALPVDGSSRLMELERVFPPPHQTTYRMGVYLDTSSLTLSGKSIIETRNSSTRPLRELYFTVYPNAFLKKETTPAPLSAYREGFDAGWLLMDQVEVNGRAAETHLQEISLRVLLPEDILPGDAITINMAWKAQIPRVAYRYGAQDGVIMLSNFYPVLNVCQDGEWLLSSNTAFGDPFCFQCADYQVKVNLPSEFGVVSSGSTLGREAEASGRDTLIIEATRARDFVLVAAWPHQTVSSQKMGVELKCHVFPGNEAVGREMLNKAGEMLKYFACTFGSYPFPELDIIQVPMEGFQGMEYSGVIFLRQEVFSDSYGEDRRDFLVAHELAHQWWFGLVGSDQVREPWLDEGLANWSARRYLKEREGKSYPPDYNIHDGANLSLQLGEMHSKTEYLNTAYTKGEAFWFALENEIGKERVIQILRRFLADYRYRIASTADLKQIISEEAGRDMEGFFQKWFQESI